MKRLPPYPVFPGEKYVGLGYKYMLADEEAPLLAINRVLCLVEYREDGSSKNMFRQYVRNPRGFAFLRKEGMKRQPSRAQALPWRRCITCPPPCWRAMPAFCRNPRIRS